MDKKILFVLFLLIACALIIVYLRGSFGGTKTGGATVSIGNTLFTVEVAETLPAQVRGLSGHAPLGEREGMLFLFGEARSQAFWMKEMLFPIDIIWIHNNIVIGFAEHAPVPSGGAFSSPAMFSSPEPVETVLEVADGAVARFGIKIGDTVDINRP